MEGQRQTLIPEDLAEMGRLHQQSEAKLQGARMEIQSLQNEAVRLQRRNAEQTAQVEHELRTSRTEEAQYQYSSQDSTNECAAELVPVREQLENSELELSQQRSLLPNATADIQALRLAVARVQVEVRRKQTTRRTSS